MCHCVLCSSCSPTDSETLALQEDALQVLLCLTTSPLGLQHLLASGCPLATVRVLLAGGVLRDRVRQLLLQVMGQAPAVARHLTGVSEAVALMATELRTSQVVEPVHTHAHTHAHNTHTYTHAFRKI